MRAGNSNPWGMMYTVRDSSYCLNLRLVNFRNTIFNFAKESNPIAPYIFPIVGHGYVGVDQPQFRRRDFTFYGAYPNPASGQLFIRYELETPVERRADGKHDQLVDVSDLPCGAYLYTLKSSNGARFASRFMIEK